MKKLTDWIILNPKAAAIALIVSTVWAAIAGLAFLVK